MIDLSFPVDKIPRIGPQYQKKLGKLGIKTIGQLIFHFPHRYEDFSNVKKISEIKPEEKVSIKTRLIDIKNIITFKRRMHLTQATFADETGSLKAVWFNRPYLINNFKKNDLVFLSGKMSGKYLSNPAYEKIYGQDETIHTGRLVPVYPETEGLSSRWLRYILRPLLLQNKDRIEDALPQELVKKFQFLPLNKAIWQIHFPDSLELAEKARERFSFEELFLLELKALKEKMNLKREKALAIPIDVETIKEFLKSLPFQITDAQKKSIWQILKDMEKGVPMNRLLEGDVGSGKTIVAMTAALNAAKAGAQTAIMAPTEILAMQHNKNFNQLLKKFKVSVGLLTGKDYQINNRKVKRDLLLKKLEQGKVQVLIGTNALVQSSKTKTPKVTFQNLALAVVDEQHRFGIEQRARLCRGKNSKERVLPHLLSMTATPIPRTLALTIYGDLDVSLLDELPQGRKKIITRIVPPEKRERAYDFVRKEVKKGRQVFVICPRIEHKENQESTSYETRAVKKEYEKLSKEIFPDLRAAMLHGRIKSHEKSKTMKKFREGKIDILVSTSVIEVGIDIPNASLMMIEGSEKFGLSQLHQFRGRVGRGESQSYCLLFTDLPFGIYTRRLKAMTTTDNGFELAEKDLSIRGPGEMFGIRQWGIPDLAMASLKNTALVEKTRQEARNLLQKDPELKKHPLLAEKLKEFRKTIHLE
jgi:ATP-dependent DNA helicase RecG